MLSNYLIIANETKDTGLKWSRYTLDRLHERGLSASLEICVDEAGNEVGIDLDLGAVDIIIVMGGDGTMLRVAQLIGGSSVPVIGVNLGVVGFMTEVVVSEIDHMIDRLVAGDYVIEDRMMLSGTVHSQSGEYYLDALNDIVLARENTLRLIAVGINVNDRYFDTIEADGIIVSTPTGSTSYNLSAGGPIVQPDARLMVMTPISPYSLSKRSVVFGANDKITLKLLEKRRDSDNSGMVSFDGADNFAFEVGDTVDITASDSILRLIKLDEASVYEILRKKVSD